MQGIYPNQIRDLVSVYARLRTPKRLLGLFLGVLKITYRRDACTDFDRKYVKNVVLRKDVLGLAKPKCKL